MDKPSTDRLGAEHPVVHPLSRIVLSRRGALAAGGTLGSVVTLAACSADGPGSAGTTDTSTSAPAAEGVLTPLADVPVGSALVLEASDGVPVVVAQPSAGEVVGFSARCTHEGCAVAVADA